MLRLIIQLTETKKLIPAQASEAYELGIIASVTEPLTSLIALSTDSTISASRTSEPKNMTFQASFWTCSILFFNTEFIHSLLCSFVSGAEPKVIVTLSWSFFPYSSIRLLFSFLSFSYAKFHSSPVFKLKKKKSWRISNLFLAISATSLCLLNEPNAHESSSKK